MTDETRQAAERAYMEISAALAKYEAPATRRAVVIGIVCGAIDAAVEKWKVEADYHEKRSIDMQGALGDANVEVVNLRAKLATVRVDLLQPVYEELMFVVSFQKPTRKQVLSVMNKVATALAGETGAEGGGQ